MKLRRGGKVYPASFFICELFFQKSVIPCKARDTGSSFVSSREVGKAGSHLAPTLCYGLDGMTEQYIVLGIKPCRVDLFKNAA